MRKLCCKDIRKAYTEDKTVMDYVEAVENIGLWESEAHMIQTYFKLSDKLLDLGCGGGRTTFGMYERGYKNLTAVDISPKMIQNARRMNREKGYDITFQEGNAVALVFDDASFDGVLFSFNGLMQIPGIHQRYAVLKEVCRVLKKGGHFIFTTHDRNNPSYKKLWEYEMERWKHARQDHRLHELGDLMIDRDGREIYLHVPTKKAIQQMIRDTGFECVLLKERSELAVESERVKKFASGCLFWVLKK